MEYIKLFEKHSDYETYINSEDKKLPNLSYCEDVDDVHLNPWVETKLICTYNVTDTTTPIKIMVNENVITAFSEIEIDGVVQPTVTNTYTFDTTGLHTIKYTLVDPTFIGFGNYSLFYNCSELISVKIPDTAITILSAFASCINLTNITIPNSVTTIGNLSFDSCSNLTNITIPNSVTSIGNSAFSYCSKLSNIIIPNSVTTISGTAFNGCTGLTSITIPDSVTSIGSSIFDSCNKLLTVTIGKNITFIGNYAFSGCSAITSITINAIIPPTLDGSAVFSYSYPIYVPAESVEAYKTAQWWSIYANRIQAIP